VRLLGSSRSRRAPTQEKPHPFSMALEPGRQGNRRGGCGQ